MALQPQTRTTAYRGTIHPGTVQRDQRPASAGAPKQSMRIPQLPWLDFSPEAMAHRSALRAQSDISGLEAALPTTQSIQQTYEPQQQAAISLGNAVADHLRAAQQYQAGMGAVGGAPSASTTGQVYGQTAPAAAAGQALAYGQANTLGSMGDAASLRGLAQSQLFGRQETQALTNRAAQESAIDSRQPGLQAGYMDQERTLANQQNIARYNGAIAMLNTEASLGLKQSQLEADINRANQSYGLGLARIGEAKYATDLTNRTNQAQNDAQIAHWSAQEKNQRISAAAAYLRAQNGGQNASKVDETWMYRASAAADKALKGGTQTVPAGTAKVTFTVPSADPLHPNPSPRSAEVPAAVVKQGNAAILAWLTPRYTSGQVIDKTTGQPETLHLGSVTPVTAKQTVKGSYQDIYNAALHTLQIHYPPDVAKALALRIAKERMNPPARQNPRFPASATTSGPRSPNAPG